MSQAPPSPKPNPPKQFMGEDQGIAHHVSRRRKRDIDPANMNLNLTSMIDVIFLLLIYFVITANFAVGEGVIKSKLPEGTGGAPKPEDQFKTDKKLYVRIASGSRPTDVVIEVTGGQVTTFRELIDELRRLQRNDENTSGVYKVNDPVVITPSGDVRWQHVVNAFNAATAAKYTDIRFGDKQ